MTDGRMGQNGRSKGVKLNGSNEWKWTVIDQTLLLLNRIIIIGLKRSSTFVYDLPVWLNTIYI